MSQEDAKNVMNEVYRDIADHMNDFDRNSEHLFELVKRAWNLGSKKNPSKAKSDFRIRPYFEKFDLETRSIVTLSDIMGFSLEDIQKLMGLSEEKVVQKLVQGRNDLLEVMS